MSLPKPQLGTVIRGMRRGNKFGAVRTEFDGVVYHSRREAQRARQLATLLRAERIRELRRQVKYVLKVGEAVICSYVADFVYLSYEHGQWRQVVEDVKGMRTREYLLKKRLMKALHNIDILET